MKKKNYILSRCSHLRLRWYCNCKAASMHPLLVLTTRTADIAIGRRPLRNPSLTWTVLPLRFSGKLRTSAVVP